MKKFTVLALAALLVVAFAMPASALENIFGGYWHTRFLTQKNFDGDNRGNLDLRQVETRTRLYYTAKLNDNLKLVNKFEMDTVWGDKNTNVIAGANNTAAAGATPIWNGGNSSGYSQNWGDSGADGVAIEIKNSYADFNVGPVNFLVGVQNFTLGRGFISNDDASGMKAIWKVNDGLYLPFIWQKMKEGGAGQDANEMDIDAYICAPIIYLSKDIKINPYYVFLHSKDGGLMPLGTAVPTATGVYGLADNINVHVAGLDFDAKMGAASLWFTGIMQFGSVQDNTGALTGAPADQEVDLKGYLLAAGGKFDLGKADIHGQVLYATGEELGGAGNTAYGDKEMNAYFTTSSTLYAWAEIMGAGMFDNSAANVSSAQIGSYGAPGYFVSNVMAANIGVTVKPMDKLTVTADLWYAKLEEENVFGEDELGIEADLKVSYKLVEGLTLDVVAAYLFAGDATESAASATYTFDNGKNVKDPFELGAQLSLSF
jgi:hypothetical protein